MALLPKLTKGTLKKPGKENKPSLDSYDDDNDFIPIKKKPKVNPEDTKSMFEHFTLKNCTINIQYSK